MLKDANLYYMHTSAVKNFDLQWQVNLYIGHWSGQQNSILVSEATYGPKRPLYDAAAQPWALADINRPRGTKRPLKTELRRCNFTDTSTWDTSDNTSMALIFYDSGFAYNTYGVLSCGEQSLLQKSFCFLQTIKAYSLISLAYNFGHFCVKKV